MDAPPLPPPPTTFDDLNGKTNFLVKHYPAGTFVRGEPTKPIPFVVNPDEDF